MQSHIVRIELICGSARYVFLDTERKGCAIGLPEKSWNGEGRLRPNSETQRSRIRSDSVFLI
jgi:hypothetical protein